MRISRLLAALVVLGLAGCSYVPPAPTNPQVFSVSAEEKAAARQAATKLARDWDAATAAVKGPLYLPYFDGPQGTTNWGTSLVSPGMETQVVLRGAPELPAPPHPTAPVRWDDGVEIVLPMASASDTLIRAYPTSRCEPGCVYLDATSAELTISLVDTVRGWATAPVWLYHVRGSLETVMIPAVVGPKIALPPAPGGGIYLDSSEGSVTSRTLTVSFTGSPGDSSQPCGADYSGDTVESERAVVVIIYYYGVEQGGNCPMVGAERTVTLTLSSPLGERTVLGLAQNQPPRTNHLPGGA